MIIEEISEEFFNDLNRRLDALETTEKQIHSTRRLEQGYLKNYLFGQNSIGTCACCQRQFPVSFLVTAHIKKRAFCTSREKKDLNIVMPLCNFGCDDLFEKGYITVKDKIFINLKKAPLSADLERYIGKIIGNECKFYNMKTKSYFDWHLASNS